MHSRCILSLATLWLTLLFVTIAPAQKPAHPPTQPSVQPSTESKAPPKTHPPTRLPSQTAALPDLSDVAVSGIHDPSMIKAGDTWYVFSTTGRTEGPQLPIHCSTNLVIWTPCGFVFPQTPAWIKARLPAVKDLWAPDISFEHGEYRVYYAYSVFGRNTSGIALVTNKTLDPSSPDYSWVDRGIVLETGVKNDFNAIDPNFLRDQRGKDWLAFGSFYRGIKLHELASDGLFSIKQKRTYTLAERKRPAGQPWPKSGDLAAWEAIEAPFLVWHDGFYYLFTSWDLCCRGAESNYHVVVGRAHSITGPYRDKTNVKLSAGGGTLLLAGKNQWAGPGGQSVWMDPAGVDLLIYHAYKRTTGRVFLRLASLTWKDGWPMVRDAP